MKVLCWTNEGLEFKFAKEFEAQSLMQEMDHEITTMEIKFVKFLKS
jgi:hypothetical protein